MNAKHTPGPWAWYTGGNHKALVRPGVDGRILMQRDVDGELIYEDACLIAAAPALLEALKNCLSVIEFMAAEMGRLDAVRGSEGYGLARAAIAAALGE